VGTEAIHYKEYNFLGSKGQQRPRNLSTFRRNVLLSQTELKTKPSKQAASKEGLFTAFFLTVISIAYSLTLKMEAVSFSEKSVNLFRTTRGNIPDESSFQTYASFSSLFLRL
jgi:hypothetical protein